MRITDQYFWNFVFSIFFIALVVFAAIVLDSVAYKTVAELELVDYVIMILASLRLTRLFVYDKITAFFREQFYDAEVVRKQVRLVKPESGPKRTILDLLLCPWCFGIWATALVVFLYLLTPIFWYPILFLALSAVVSSLQIFMNFLGWKAEEAKHNAGGN